MCKYLKSDIGSSSHISQNFADAVTLLTAYLLSKHCLVLHINDILPLCIRYVFDL